MFDDVSLLDKIARSDERIERLQHQGQFVWVKRQEHLDLRMRLQKGDTAKAFERERKALHVLNELGAPVPEIMAEGPDFFVTPDSGKPLDRILSQSVVKGEDHSEEFVAAAQALADLHDKHLTHGHPRIKDICWKPGKITFIDFERYRESLNTPFGHARDVATFFFSGLAVAGKPMPELFAARDAYRAADTGNIWQGAETLVRRLKFMDWLTKPLQNRKNGRGREFNAIPMTLEFFGAR